MCLTITLCKREMARNDFQITISVSLNQYNTVSNTLIISKNQFAKTETKTQKVFTESYHAYQNSLPNRKPQF